MAGYPFRSYLTFFDPAGQLAAAEGTETATGPEWLGRLEVHCRLSSWGARPYGVFTSTQTSL